jgi:hypothetical protein
MSKLESLSGRRAQAAREKLKPYPSLLIGMMVVGLLALKVGGRGGIPKDLGSFVGWGLGQLMGCFLVAGIVWALVWFGFLRWTKHDLANEYFSVFLGTAVATVVIAGLLR